MKDCVSFSIYRNQKCAQHILENTLSECAQFTLPIHSSKIKQSHVEIFLFFSDFFFACTFFILYLIEHKEKNIKNVGKLASYQVVFIFHAQVVVSNWN